uniref:DNA primase n=1 Tax=viral metagenome TaxID=1070528 RepID=A0A6C0LQF2_9ZZZZ
MNKKSKIKVLDSFTIVDAINIPINSNNVFIVANERKKKDGKISRYYSIFEKFEDFLRIRNHPKMAHCHEILIDHINNEPNKSGRLAFDFDIKDVNVPKNFKDQIQQIIIDVVDIYFHDVDHSKFEYVWSTSKNPAKFSKHLIVKNFYFDDWIQISKIFYDLFCIQWDINYDWISSDKIIDFQIIKRNTSLRMVGSSKIGGNPLELDDEGKFSLIDSLIRIYSINDSEQTITMNNINNSIVSEFMDKNINKYFAINIEKKQKYSKTFNCDNYPDAVYKTAFEMYEAIHPKIFKMNKRNGKYLSMLRMKSAKCLLSGRVHENENAFIKIFSLDDMYSINFGCYRNCGKIKYIHIGSISKTTFEKYFDPKFEPKLLNQNKLRFCEKI